MSSTCKFPKTDVRERERERERSSHKLSKDLGKKVVGSMTGKCQTMKVPTTFDMSKFWEKS